LMDASDIAAAVTLGGLLVTEAVAPFFIEQRRDWRRLLRHDLRNLAIGGLNALCFSSLFAAAVLVLEYEVSMRGYGLLWLLDLPNQGRLAVGVVLFDLWMYWWHRMNHAVPFLWRFHRMHHSDPAMDASSAVRFHPGEIFLSGLARLIVLPLIGMPLMVLLVYEAILLPVILFHHANIRLPRWLDFGLFRAGLLVTPAMHRVHHSRVREETNSNYGSVLPLWDRLFGSLRVRRDVDQIALGLDDFADERNQTLNGMLTTPLANPKDHTDPRSFSS
ncbi:MAG: sterol desaturase family protein, partial [Planctomycetota bacterium]